MFGRKGTKYSGAKRREALPLRPSGRRHGFSGWTKDRSYGSGTNHASSLMREPLANRRGLAMMRFRIRFCMIAIVAMQLNAVAVEHLHAAAAPTLAQLIEGAKKE